MSTKLEHWVDVETSDVRRMAEEGMGAREIAGVLGVKVAAVLSSAPDLFESMPESAAHTCQDCGRPLPNDSADRRRCQFCVIAPRQDLVERVRVMQATGMSNAAIAERLEVGPGEVTTAVKQANRQRLHRQKPMRSRN